MEAAAGDAPGAGVVADGVDGAVEAGVLAGLAVDAPTVDGIFGGADDAAPAPADEPVVLAEVEAELGADALLWWLRLGGLGSDGVVIGGLGSETGMVTGFRAGKIGVGAWLVVAGLTSACATPGTPTGGADAGATAVVAALVVVAGVLAEGGACVDAEPTVVGLASGVEAGADVAATAGAAAVDAAAAAGVDDVAAAEIAGIAALTGLTAAVV